MKRLYLFIIIIATIVFQSCCTLFNIGCPCPFEQKEWMVVSQSKIDSIGYDIALKLSVAAKADADSLPQKIKANANLSSEIEMNKFNNERNKQDSKVEVTQEFFQKWTSITAAMCNTWNMIHDKEITNEIKYKCSEDLRQYASQLANIGYSLKVHYDSLENDIKNVDPKEIITIIKEKQKENVKESINENNCFTEDNMKQFKNNNVIEKVEKELNEDSHFLIVVQAIKSMSDYERGKLINQMRNTYKPTWEQIHKISNEGQTDAGQKTEKMIAESITNLVKKLIKD